MINKLKKGDLVIKSLSKILEGKSGTLFAIGALEWAELALYDLEGKQYFYKKVDGPLELSSFLGIIAKLPSGETGVHAHVGVCDKNFSTYSGHLKEAKVSATLEYSFFENDVELERYADGDIGLNLLK